MKLFSIIKKNFKLLLRSRTSALIVILGPLLIILLAGIAFNTSKSYSLNIGTYSPSYNALINSFIERLTDKQFAVRQFETENSCIDAIKKGTIHTCIVFPKDLDFENPSIENEITFHVDYSKINLVWIILDIVSSKISSRSRELSINLTTVILDKLDRTKQELQNDLIVIDALVSENKDVNDKVSEVKASLSSMQLSFNKNDLKADEIAAKTAEVNSKVTLLLGYSSASIATTQQLIDNVNNAAGMMSANASGKGILVSSANDAQTQVTDLSSSISNISSLISSYNSDIASLLSVMQASSDDLQARLDKAASLKSSASSKLDVIKSTLDKAASELSAVKNSVRNIIANIESTKVKDAQSIVSPVKTKISPVTPETSNLNYVFPSLIVLVIMFISILLSSTLVMMEKMSRAYFRNFVTPTRDATFIFSAYLTNMLILVLQLIIILAISTIFLREIVLLGLLKSLPLLLLITTIFTFIGICIGYLFNSEETSTMASISVGAIMIFLSNLILPLESMPDYVRQIAAYNPFVISEVVLRKLMVFNSPFIVIKNEIGMLIAFVVLFIGLTLGAQQLMKHRFLAEGISIFRKKKKEEPKESEEQKETKLSFKSIGELVGNIFSMPDHDFEEAIKEKNIYAEWVLESYKDEALYSKLKDIRKRTQFLSIIKKHLEEKTK
ncbi:MAG: ABC transporter permease [Candidatus Woesearchaeota archaeon]|nr:ABC transporter permease [Candidatus Woesearchaeota archaeon]